MKVVLTRKLAERIDDIDLERFNVGDIVDIPELDEQLLIAEGWATVDRRTVSQDVPHERRGAEPVARSGG